MRCTSGSSGSKAGGDTGCSGVSCTGLVALGSSPALIALRMRRAWYFAYFVFAAISASLFFHIDIISRKVDAARSVSTVCLSTPVSLGFGDGAMGHDKPIDSILCHLPLCLSQRLQGKLLAVGACDGVVDQGILAGVLGLCLLEPLHEIGRVGGAFLVGRVQPARDDFLDHVEAHCSAISTRPLCRRIGHQRYSRQ